MFTSATKTPSTLYNAALLLLLLFVGLGTPFVSAHGTNISYEVEGNSVAITAMFDNGEPMADAQYVVYAPNDPTEPIVTGQADSNGFFVINIDPAISGNWDVTIRTGGHGEIVNIPVAENGQIGELLSTSEGRPLWQTALIVVGVFAVLGGIGLAARKGKPEHART